MQRVVIIDGHNLLHKIPGIKDRYKQNPDFAITSLVKIIKPGLKKNEKLVLVLDGFGTPLFPFIIYSGNKSADYVIRGYIEENYQKTSIVVISSDREITNLAKACGCEVMLSEDFFNKTKNMQSTVTVTKKETNEKPETISKKEFEEFKKYFSK